MYLLKGLDGIGAHDKEAIQCSFEADSVDLKIRGFKGKNLRFVLKPLSYHVNAAACRIQVKSNSISITLKKEEQKQWINLTKKAGLAQAVTDKEAANPDSLDDSDPQASLMKMMKNLYQTGDDDMKRTISESFAKAQSGQLPGAGGLGDAASAMNGMPMP